MTSQQVCGGVIIAFGHLLGGTSFLAMWFPGTYQSTQGGWVAHPTLTPSRH